jgi:hypothetical protein
LKSKSEERIETRLFSWSVWHLFLCHLGLAESNNDEFSVPERTKDVGITRGDADILNRQLKAQGLHNLKKREVYY